MSWARESDVAEDSSHNLAISLDDLEVHLVRFGLDVFPPLDFRDETTRAHELFRLLHDQRPDIYQELTYRPSANEFTVQASFGGERGAAKIPTLTLAPRGPVFRFPRRLPEPIGDVELGDSRSLEDLEAVFFASLNVIRRCAPGLTILRAGLVQELVFSMGQTSTVPWLASRFGGISGAQPHGGNVKLTYADDRCNALVTVETVQLQRQATLASGADVAQAVGFGLKVELDVCNREMRPQEPAEIQMTLQRAHSLWPNELLTFLNWSGPR